MEDLTCDGCAFAVMLVGDDQVPNVKCRRFPPQLFWDGEYLAQSFPDAIFRCGEYKEENNG